MNEDEWKAANASVQIRAPKINSSIRDRSCIVTFPKGTSDQRLTRSLVEEIMKREWGVLFSHVLSFGNIDFSRQWVFHFDTLENNDRAVSKEIFINNQRIKTIHATRKFNQLKIDWIPLWKNLDDLKEILKEVEGINGKFVDARWARGDKVALDSTQAIFRFYKDDQLNFDPPQYVHFYDDYGRRVFMRLTVIGETTKKCMKCSEAGHNIGDCPKRFCYKCGKLVN